MHSVGPGNSFLHDDAKLRESLKPDIHAFHLAGSDFYNDDRGQDMFDMSSFFRDHDTAKIDSEDTREIASGGPQSVKNDSDHNTSADTTEESPITTSDESIVMGIPYYVACQWQQMQQQQQQQQQAVMMLWWQAYLSGAYNMCGPKGMAQTPQLGWSLPSAGLAAFHGAYANFGDDAFYQRLLTTDEKSNNGLTHGIKRRRKNDINGNDPTQIGNKKGRRQRHDERVLPMHCFIEKGFRFRSVKIAERTKHHFGEKINKMVIHYAMHVVCTCPRMTHLAPKCYGNLQKREQR